MEILIEVWTRGGHSPPLRLSWVPAAMLWCDRAPRMVCSKEGGQAVPETPWPIGQMSVIPRYPSLFSILLVEIGLPQPIGSRHGADPVTNLPNRSNQSGIPKFLIE